MIILPELVAPEAVALVELDGALETGHVQAHVVRLESSLTRVREDLRHGRGRGSRIIYYLLVINNISNMEHVLHS